MTKYARIIGNVAHEVFTPPEGFTLADCFHEDVAAQFSPVPDSVEAGWALTNGAWSAPVVTPQPVVYPPLTPMQFYLAFKPAERMAIKKSTDENVAEFWATFELAQQSGTHIDPNLTSVQEALEYLAQPATTTPPGPGILASADRIAQILAGIPQ